MERGLWQNSWKSTRKILILTYGIPELFTLCHPPFPLRDYKSLPEDEPTFYDFRKNEEVAKAGFKDNYSTIIFRWLSTSLADPDPYPGPYPYVFGFLDPGPDLLIRRPDPDLAPDPDPGHSIIKQKYIKKNLDSYCIVTFYLEKWYKCTFKK